VRTRVVGDRSCSIRSGERKRVHSRCAAVANVEQQHHWNPDGGEDNARCKPGRTTGGEWFSSSDHTHGTAIGTFTNAPLAASAIPTGPNTCPILHLDIGPISLNLLGLVVTVPNNIVLDITAVSGPGNLLGNLLCAVTNLLNQPPSALNQIVTLLNQILALL
jgi:hypothetical protein